MTPRAWMPALALALAQVASCGWSLPDNGGRRTLAEPLWDAAGVVATSDALYVHLPAAQRLLRIAPDEDPVDVDFGAGGVTGIAAAPNGDTVVAFVDRTRCEPDDERDARGVSTVADCAVADRVVESEIALVTGTEAISGQPINGAYNAVEFSDDGRYAVAYVDFSQEVDLDGVVNLTGVVLIDLSDNSTRLVTVGFAPDQVLYTYDESGAAVSAVVLSRNAVANVRLDSDSAPVTQFPLTLDPDTQRDPNGVVLTPDGRYALISTDGSPDLYALDLVNESINIVDLSAEPAAMAVDTTEDRTVLVYTSRPVVEVMEHDFFEVDTLDLDEGMNEISVFDGRALLWTTARRYDVYRLDLENNELVEYRIQNPAISMHVAPTGDFAIALTRAEGGGGTGIDSIYDANPGMEIIDLSSNDSAPFILEGTGRGVAFAADDVNLNALVLQDGQDYVYRYDLRQRVASEIELSAPPISIGSLSGSGLFWITHERALGLVSFLDPTDGSITEVSGFADLGLIEPIDLVSTEEAP